jgi:hypothetical protein
VPPPTWVDGIGAAWRTTRPGGHGTGAGRARDRDALTGPRSASRHPCCASLSCSAVRVARRARRSGSHTYPTMATFPAMRTGSDASAPSPAAPGRRAPPVPPALRRWAPNGRVLSTAGCTPRSVLPGRVSVSSRPSGCRALIGGAPSEPVGRRRPGRTRGRRNARP